MILLQATFIIVRACGFFFFFLTSHNILNNNMIRIITTIQSHNSDF